MKKLLRFMKPHKGLLIGAILCVVINNFTVLYLPNIVSKIIDDGALSGDAGQIYRLGALMLVVAVIGGIVYFFSVTLASKAVARFARDVRRRCFRQGTGFFLERYAEVRSSVFGHSLHKRHCGYSALCTNGYPANAPSAHHGNRWDYYGYPDRAIDGTTDGRHHCRRSADCLWNREPGDTVVPAAANQNGQDDPYPAGSFYRRSGNSSFQSTEI